MKKLIFSLRKYIYLSLFSIDQKLGLKNPLIILSYHGISKDQNFFSVFIDDFESQIKSTLKYYQPLSLVDLINFLEGKKTIKKPSFILTFDDGYKDVLAVQSFLQKLGVNPTIFVLADPQSANRKELDRGSLLLTTDEIKRLIGLGWEIGCHSATHANLVTLDKVELENEIAQSKKKLERSLSQQVRFFAYPKGKYSDEIIDLVKKSGYDLALSMDDGIITQATNRYKIPRIGVNGTHSLSEFRSLPSPTIVRFRKMLKLTIGGFYEHFWI